MAIFKKKTTDIKKKQLLFTKWASLSLEIVDMNDKLHETYSEPTVTLFTSMTTF